MISLTPSWAKHYEQFWNSVKTRNLWFIELRYAAVALLVILLLAFELVFDFPLSGTQLQAISFITLSILFYNLIIHKYRKTVTPEGKFNNLHLSLFQMGLDLAALTLLIYFTGGIENPLYMFYIFHMIIGSMILPGAVIYTMAGFVVLMIATMSLLEYYAVIPHHAIQGLFHSPIYNNINYLVIFVIVFSLMMFISVMLANKIARQLYEREQELRETLDKLNEAEAEKQRYIIGIVHEIKTPVIAVQSLVDLMLFGFIGSISEKVIEKLNRVRVRTDEAIQLINNILHISKIKLLDEISQEELDLKEVIEEMICKYKSLSELNEIDIVFINDTTSETKIKGDKVLLEIALSNIIGNAIKYVGSNGRIEVVLCGDVNTLKLEICDNGIGIPKDEVNKIFDEFYRASNIKSRKIEGAGMGLSVVKQIIKRHGGKISVVSPSRLGDSVKPGTSFILNLPL